MLQGFGIDVPEASPKALDRILELSDAELLSIAESYELTLQLVATDFPDKKISNEIEKEIRIAKAALRHHGLRAQDSFWESLEKDQIIEIYNSDMKQIYRSFSFFRHCGYSILDLSVFEWFALFQRSQIVMAQMHADVDKVLTLNLPLHKAQTQPHLMKQGLDTGVTLDFRARICHVEFHHLGALAGFGPGNQAAGFICTCSAETVAKGPDAHSLDFI